MKNAVYVIGLVIGSINIAPVFASISEFMPSEAVYHLTQNQSINSCVRSSLQKRKQKQAIVIVESLAGHDAHQAESMNSGLIQALISLTKRSNFALFNRSAVFEGFDFSQFESHHFVSATFAGFESGGENHGKGFGVSSKYLGIGTGKTQGKSLLQLDFHIAKANGQIIDGFSLANIVQHIDNAKDSEIGGSSFSVYLDFSKGRDESKTLARRIILNHAAVMILESILGQPFNCHYKNERANTVNHTSLNAIEVINIVGEYIPEKSKSFYFKRSDARSLRCRKHKCKVLFRGQANQDIAAYMEEALLNAFPDTNNLDVLCTPKNGQINCQAKGELKGFSKSKFRRNLYGS